jgi:hypothetical protein
MAFWHKNPSAPVDRAARLLVAEVEAFLSGSYEDLLRHRGDEIPLWAQMNSCAHGRLASLRGVLASSSADRYYFGDRWELMWRRTKRTFAQQLLDEVQGDEQRLFDLQRRVLVPLELELIAEEAAGDLSPLKLVRSLRAALGSESM